MTEFSRPTPLDRLGAQGVTFVVEADACELTALAARLQLPAVARLWCRFHLRRAEDAMVAATGQLEAEVTQVCVLSLEEFDQRVQEAFALNFVPEGSETDDPDPDALDQVPYIGNAIDLGEAATEQLALALDPYPRMPGMDEAAGSVHEASGPFAALAALRREQ